MARRLRRLLPSPAMVVALTALVMSLGGSAYALVITGKSIRNGSVTGRDIRNGSLRGKDVRNHSLRGTDVKRDTLGGSSINESSLGLVPGSVLTYGSQRYAVVNAAGQAVRSRGATAAARTGRGLYYVAFDGDVHNCAYFATIGGPGAAAPPQNSQISVSSLAVNVNGVAVRTERGDGVEVNRPFHLIVMC